MIEDVNIALFKSINSFAGINPVLDYLGIITANYLPFIFILWLAYLGFRKERAGKKIALYAGFSAALGILFNFLISSVYYHPRPFMLHIATLLIPHAAESSFPSDHTTFMLSIAFLLIYYRETRASGIVLSIMGVVGGLARVFSGLHFPLDILGSIGVALIASLLAYSFGPKLIEAYSGPGHQILHRS